MTYLGVDLHQARELVTQLQRAARGIDTIAAEVSCAEMAAALPVSVDGLLDEIRSECLVLASRVDRSVRLVESYRLSMRLPWAGPAPSAAFTGDGDLADQIEPFVWRPQAARWDAEPGAAWNEVHQESSHNSYAAQVGIEGLYDVGVRSFELDIHRGFPTDFAVGPTMIWDIPHDHLTHGGSRPDDWWVYHTSLDPVSEYETLRDGLQALARLPATDPLTVFIDIKDAFTQNHSAATLDELLVEAFGDRLFTPGDVMDRAPEAATLQAAIAEAGWPSVVDLETRVIVVVTGEVANYASVHPKAFIALTPTFAPTDDGGTVHVPDLSVIFYNEHRRQISALEIQAISVSGSLLRTYGHAACDDDPGDPWPHYRASDIELDDPRCHQ